MTFPYLKIITIKHANEHIKKTACSIRYLYCPYSKQISSRLLCCQNCSITIAVSTYDYHRMLKWEGYKEPRTRDKPSRNLLWSFPLWSETMMVSFTQTLISTVLWYILMYFFMHDGFYYGLLKAPLLNLFQWKQIILFAIVWSLSKSNTNNA